MRGYQSAFLFVRSYSFYRSDRTYFKATAAVQTVVPTDIIGLRKAFVNAALLTDGKAFSAACAFFGYEISFVCYLSAAYRE